MPLTVLLLSADPDLKPLYRDLLTGAGYRVETAALPVATQEPPSSAAFDPERAGIGSRVPNDAATTHAVDAKTVDATAETVAVKTETVAVKAEASNAKTTAADVAVLFTSPVTAPAVATTLRRKGISTLLVAAPAEDPDAPNTNPTDPVAIAHVHDQLWQAGIAELLVAPTPLDLLRAIEDAAATDASELVTRHRNLGVVSASATTEGGVSHAPAAPEDEDDPDL